MVETVLAVLAVSFLFLALFRLSCLLTGKVVLQHAAMRVARARSVGFNDYMCRKSARVAAITRWRLPRAATARRRSRSSAAVSKRSSSAA